MSKTTTIKITTRIITTHLPCLDTTITIKSHPHVFGEMSVFFGEPGGEDVLHRERLGAAAAKGRATACHDKLHSDSATGSQFPDWSFCYLSCSPPSVAA